MSETTPLTATLSPSSGRGSVSKAVPDSRARYAHFLTITTRLMDNDIYAHVNNATYYSFIDTAVSTYLAQALERDLAHDPIVYYVVENGCTYFSPIAFPDRVACGLRVTHIGTSSMRFEVGRLQERRGPHRRARLLHSGVLRPRDAAADRNASERACSARSDPAGGLEIVHFELAASDGAARLGRLTTDHGAVDTPAFMPVGTYGTVKAMSPDELQALGAQIVLGNTFHLWLRPGLDVIAAHGGLASLHGLAGTDPHRFGRFPGFQSGRFAQSDGGGRQIPVAGQWRCVFPHA